MEEREIHDLFGTPREICPRLKQKLEARGEEIPPPSAVYGWEGQTLTRHDLPEVPVKRWVTSRKMIVIALVRGGIVPLKEVLATYDLTRRAYEEWDREIAEGGRKALMATSPIQLSVSDLATEDDELVEGNGFPDTVSYAAATLNTKEQIVRAPGRRPVKLTGKETELLTLFMQHCDEVVSRRQIWECLYTGVFDPDLKIIDVFVCKLRGKLSRFRSIFTIETGWGRGYKLQGAFA